MEELMSQDDREWRINEWVEQTIQPQDSISIHEQEEKMDYGEPMMRANHGASDQDVCKKVWKHAQRLTNKDGKPRIPLKTHISEAPDVESQAALRRGVAAEEYRGKRDQSRHQEWEKNRRQSKSVDCSKLSDHWEEVPYRRRKMPARSHKPQSIRLEKRYETLYQDAEEEMQSYGAV